MQEVGWLPVTPVEGLTLPYWAGTWFGLFPTWEGLLAQAAAATFVVGSYVAAEALRKRKRSGIVMPGAAAVDGNEAVATATAGAFRGLPRPEGGDRAAGFRPAESRSRTDLPPNLPGEVRQLRFEELLPRERNGLRRAGDGDDHGAAIGAGGGPREHRG